MYNDIFISLLKASGKLEANSLTDNTTHATEYKSLDSNEGRRYIWRTVGDSKVRSRHAGLDGTVRVWGDGLNPGEDYNCRCYPEFVDGDVEQGLGGLNSVSQNSADIFMEISSSSASVEDWFSKIDEYLQKTSGKSIEDVLREENKADMETLLAESKQLFYDDLKERNELMSTPKPHEMRMIGGMVAGALVVGGVGTIGAIGVGSKIIAASSGGFFLSAGLLSGSVTLGVAISVTLGVAAGGIVGGLSEVAQTRVESRDRMERVLGEVIDLGDVKGLLESDGSLKSQYYDTFRHFYAAALKQEVIGPKATKMITNGREIMGYMMKSKHDKSPEIARESMKDAYINLLGVDYGVKVKKEHPHITRDELATQILLDINNGTIPISGRDDQTIHNNETYEYVSHNTPLIPPPTFHFMKKAAKRTWK